MEDLLLSSPDPLNDSPTFQSPPKTRQKSPARRSLPPGSSSPTKKTFELDVGSQISPQKIRVTVEAGHPESEEDGCTHYVVGARIPATSPSLPRINRRRERTITTTVPVKGLSDSEDGEQDAQTPKRGRGRPRKSAGTPVPAKKAGRASTPTGKNGRRKKSIGDLVDGDDEEDYDFKIGNGVQVGRGKGRSRSRSIKGASRKSTPNAKQTNDGSISKTPSKKGRGRRKSLLPDEIVLLEEENSEGIPDHKNIEPDMDGALQPIDDNESYPPSVYSTIRSTSTIGVNDPDIVIAQFDPGNETPRRIGWSSPRIIDVTRTSGPALDSYPSPSQSPEKNVSPHEWSVGSNTTYPEQRSGSLQNNHEEEYDGECGDRLEDILESDTVLESEGFSMISVDSVPSFREHFSSPTNQQEKAPSALKNKNLDSVKGLDAAAGDDSFSTISDDVLQAATPAREAQNPNLLSVQESRINDSFSSIPPEVLQAATPAKKTLASNLQLRRGSGVENSFSSRASVAMDATTPGGDLSELKLLQLDNCQAYEDSFSAIPSAVLEAATPAAARRFPQRCEPGTSQIDTISDKRSIVDIVRSSPSLRQNSTNSTTTRLPTPEETPPPSADSFVCLGPATENVHTEKPASYPVDHSSANEVIHHQMRSSPPIVAPRRYTYTAHLRQRRELHPDMTQTPSIVFSSPSLPPPIHIPRGQALLPVQKEETERPGLSPIARAGRALQDAVRPASSPRARAQSLRSPFKSPVADRKSSSSVAPSIVSPTQGREANPLQRSNVAGNLLKNPWSSVKHQDDPFSNISPAGNQSHPATLKQIYALGLPEQRRLSEPRLSTIRSEGNSLLSDDAMSWQAEEEALCHDPTTSLINNLNSSAEHTNSSVKSNHPSSEHKMTSSDQKWAIERDAVRRKIESASTSQVIVIGSDEESSHGAAIEDDDDELLLETLNSSSPVVQQSHVLAKDHVEKPRRSKLPSPWRKNSKRLVYSDELSHISSPHPPLKTSLSTGWVNRVSVEDENVLDLSSFIIPQKENFKPRLRESETLDLSALLASSPNKSKLPVLSRSSQPNSSLPIEPSDTSASNFRKDEGIRETNPPPFKPIPQKLAFQPRVRDAGDADASSIFGSTPLKSNIYFNNIFGVRSNNGAIIHNATSELSSSTTPAPLGLSSPSRSNSLRIPPQRTPAQSSESECSHESSLSPTSEGGKENRSIDNRTLKWTETVRLTSTQMQPFVSPTKSCLRSPVKTPSNGSGSGSNRANTSPSKNVAFVSSSPLPPSPTAEPLSSTVWSRDHWIQLDSILQAWKPENNGGSEDGPKGRRRNSTRVISRLLGKKVFSQGEEMRLKQWHLEVVDEFRGIVPGWEEKIIAMRLFACIVGEEQRKRGVTGGGLRGEEVEQSA